MQILINFLLLIVSASFGFLMGAVFSDERHEELCARCVYRRKFKK